MADLTKSIVVHSSPSTSSNLFYGLTGLAVGAIGGAVITYLYNKHSTEKILQTSEDKTRPKTYPPTLVLQSIQNVTFLQTVFSPQIIAMRDFSLSATQREQELIEQHALDLETARTDERTRYRAELLSRINALTAEKDAALLVEKERAAKELEDRVKVLTEQYARELDTVIKKEQNHARETLLIRTKELMLAKEAALLVEKEHAEKELEDRVKVLTEQHQQALLVAKKEEQNHAEGTLLIREATLNAEKEAALLAVKKRAAEELIAREKILTEQYQQALLVARKEEQNHAEEILLIRMAALNAEKDAALLAVKRHAAEELAVREKTLTEQHELILAAEKGRYAALEALAMQRQVEIISLQTQLTELPSLRALVADGDKARRFAEVYKSMYKVFK